MKSIRARRFALRTSDGQRYWLTEAEVLYTDCEWHPATVLGWYRLDVAHEQLLTGLWVFWLIQLRLESGEDSWFEYVKLNIRPR
jgi:hypothetical protein